MNNKISIIMICDDNYVMPTSVTISSIARNRNREYLYVVNVIGDGLSDVSKAKLNAFADENFEINIIEQSADKFSSFHTFDENAICVASIAALLKFVIPDVLPDDNKVLYMDGDILVQEDLIDLFNYNVDDYYAGVVIDSGSIYYKHEYVDKVKHYFNSGVMLLNLDRIRKENVVAKLIDTKINLKDSNLMDQNVFNLVFDGKVRLLPIRYNFLPVNLERAYSSWTIEDINRTYGTNYESKEELYGDGAIIHFSSKDKPWKTSSVPFASDWYREYLTLDDPKEISRKTLFKGKNKDLNDLDDGLKVSVIMPVYNVEAYLEETLLSILCQTLCEFELICINDGSTDNSKAIIEKYMDKDPRIILIDKENEGQGVARNIGIQAAEGRYLYFMDSDDLLEITALERLYSCAVKDEADLVLFDGQSFFETEVLEEAHTVYKTLYIRKGTYKRLFDGQRMYREMVDNGDFKASPCLQFLRREYVVDNKIAFPEGIIHEDNVFAYYALVKAAKVRHISDVLFNRRVRANSTMTMKKSIANYVGLYTCASELMNYVNQNVLEEETAWRTNKTIFGFIKQLKSLWDESLTEEEKEICKNDPKLNVFSVDNMYLLYKQAAEACRLMHRVEVLTAEKKELKKKIDKIKKSYVYKLWRVVTYLPRKMKKKKK